MFEKILAAKKRLQGHANVTPIMTSRTLNRQVGAEIYFKCENLQRIGCAGAYVIAKKGTTTIRRQTIGYNLFIFELLLLCPVHRTLLFSSTAIREAWDS